MDGQPLLLLLFTNNLIAVPDTTDDIFALQHFLCGLTRKPDCSCFAPCLAPGFNQLTPLKTFMVKCWTITPQFKDYSSLNFNVAQWKFLILAPFKMAEQCCYDDFVVLNTVYQNVLTGIVQKSSTSIQLHAIICTYCITHDLQEIRDM